MIQINEEFTSEFIGLQDRSLACKKLYSSKYSIDSTVVSVQGIFFGFENYQLLSHEKAFSYWQLSFLVPEMR